VGQVENKTLQPKVGLCPTIEFRNIDLLLLTNADVVLHCLINQSNVCVFLLGLHWNGVLVSATDLFLGLQVSAFVVTVDIAHSTAPSLSTYLYLFVPSQTRSGTS
jgi:hypothetical protein